jgi:hypothetical protein
MKIKLINPSDRRGYPTCGESGSYTETVVCDSYEIIEEDKKIGRITSGSLSKQDHTWTGGVMEKINELVDAVNKIREENIK